MDILFLCHRIPYPPDKGDKVRSNALLAYLAKRHRVHLACFVDDPRDMEHVDDVRRIAGGECLFVPLTRAKKWRSAARAIATGQPITAAYFGSPTIAKWVEGIVARYAIDRAVVFSSAMAPYLLDNPAMDPRSAVLDLVDVDSDKWRQYASAARGPLRWIYRREAERLLRLERDAARRFGATLLVSPYEAESFAAMAPESASRIHALNNGVNRDYFAPGEFPNPFPAGELPIVMTGRMDYHPNVDGATWFFRDVMPLIAEELPNARLYVVGANPPRSLRALAGPNLVLTGHVRDVRPYLQHASAAIAPLRIARGVQNKALEAMAMAKPVIATHEATRALAVKSGTHLWVANRPADFAAATIAAVRGADRNEIARRARDYVERHHDWTRNLARLDELLTRCADELREDTKDRAVPRGIRSSWQGPAAPAHSTVPPSAASTVP